MGAFSLTFSRSLKTPKSKESHSHIEQHMRQQHAPCCYELREENENTLEKAIEDEELVQKVLTDGELNHVEALVATAHGDGLLISNSKGSREMMEK